MDFAISLELCWRNFLPGDRW